MKIEGMTAAGGISSESAVIASSEKPKPEKPRTIAVRNTTTQP
jgi:hypothetical protein